MLVEIDLSSVASADEFYEVVSKAFGLSGRWTHPCGGKWDAFYEAIELRDDLPETTPAPGLVFCRSSAAG